MKEMIKKNWIYAMMLSVATLSFTACSSDDDDNGGTLDVPAYKDVSALYTITQSGSNYSSIELTESGNYVIVRNSSNSRREITRAVANEKLAGFVVSPWFSDMTRSTTYNNIITGKYTKNGDNTFVLEGFGTIAVTSAGDSSYSLEITENGSQPYTLTAARKEQYPGAEQTVKLCRTWHISSIRMLMSGTADNEGQSLNFSIDESVDGGDMPSLMYKCYASMMRWAINASGKSVPESYFEEELAEQKKRFESAYPYVEDMIFTQVGTYMVTYKGDKLAISTWTWQGDSFDKIHYSWNYSNMTSVISGDCKVEFNGNKCIITEEKSGSADIVRNADVKAIYTLTEVK